MKEEISTSMYTLVVPRQVLDIAMEHSGILGLAPNQGIKFIGEVTSIDGASVISDNYRMVYAYDITTELVEDATNIAFLNDEQLMGQLIEHMADQQAEALYLAETNNLNYYDTILVYFLVFSEGFNGRHTIGDDVKGLNLNLTYERYLGTAKTLSDGSADELVVKPQDVVMLSNSGHLKELNA